MRREAPLTWHELGLTYRALGRSADAVAAIGKAIELDPDLPEAHNNLGIIWLRGRRAGARRGGVSRGDPDSAGLRGRARQPGQPSFGEPARFGEAREQFEIALRLRPGDAATRYNYAMLLGRTSHFDEAQRELESSLRADPEFADAHQLLGDLLMAKGQAQDAIPHYREAVRIKPESSRAHLGLGTALLAAGDVSGAVPHLQKALAGPDAATREQAAEMLRQLGK